RTFQIVIYWVAGSFRTALSTLLSFGRILLLAVCYLRCRCPLDFSLNGRKRNGNLLWTVVDHRQTYHIEVAGDPSPKQVLRRQIVEHGVTVLQVVVPLRTDV